LIASRIRKASPLLEAKRKGEMVCVRVWPYGFGNEGVAGLPEECTVIECTPLLAVFQTKRGGTISGDYERMRFGRTANGKQLKVDIEG
jgi:hypothetical protein